MASSSSPSTQTRWPFLPKTMAVPVSWHIGRVPPAAMAAFFSRASATKRSFAEASGSFRIFARLCKVARPQQVGDVLAGLEGQLLQCLAGNLEDRPALDLDGRDALDVQLAVGGLVLRQREHRAVEE